MRPLILTTLAIALLLPLPAPWRVDYDPIELGITRSQAVLDGGLAATRSVASAVGAAVAGLFHPAVRRWRRS